jgi:hypothetical protein
MYSASRFACVGLMCRFYQSNHCKEGFKKRPGCAKIVIFSADVLLGIHSDKQFLKKAFSFRVHEPTLTHKKRSLKKSGKYMILT